MVLSALDQNLAVATIRISEVVSDSTNVMALECARRRKALGRERVAAPPTRLCATHRVLRGQRFLDPASSPHFRIFALCSAGRSRCAWGFEIESLFDHLAVYLRLLAHFSDIGLAAEGIRVGVTSLEDGPPPELVEHELLTRVGHGFPHATVELDPTRTAARSYYTRLCFDISVSAPDGNSHSLVDGGFTHWPQLLLADRKERLLISGIGTEHACSILGR